MTDSSLPIYDAHAHLVSDDEKRYPKNPIPVSIEGAPKGSDFVAGVMGFPGGMHGPNPVNIKPTAEKLHDWMQEENVEAIAAVQKGLIYRTDNSYIVDAASLFPDKMSAVIIIDPMEDKTLSMIRELATRGVIAIRFFPINVADKIAWLSSKQSIAVWELADELGLIVDIEAPATDQDSMIPLIEKMARRFPSMKVVLDHIFLPRLTNPDYGIGSNFESLRDLENVSVKWTSLNMDVAFVREVAPEKVLRRAVDFFGADKVMWGSDIGTSSGTYKDMVRRGLESTALLTADERRKVMHDTGRRIFTNWQAS
jgi:predicted TIM-barrel fold metal-dependent hydrolase